MYNKYYIIKNKYSSPKNVLNDSKNVEISINWKFLK